MKTIPCPESHMKSPLSAEAKRLNEMIIDIDTNLFALHMKLAKFIAEILEEADDKRGSIDVTIDYLQDDMHHILHCTHVYIDPEDELIKISFDAHEDIAWENLNISDQYLIAQNLYTRRLSDNAYRNVS